MQVLIQRAQVWYAQVPYNDVVDESKVRPAVIVGWSPFTHDDDHNILVVPSSTFSGTVTSSRGGDINLFDPVAAGLNGSSPSFIRTRRLMSLHPKMILWDRGMQGTLCKQDWEAVITELERFFSTPQFAAVPGIDK